MTYTHTESVDKAAVFTDITTKMQKTYAAKNHDYGNAFGKSVDEFGLIAAIVRMNDKMERIKSIVKMKPEELQVKGESIEDTLLDLANYSVMTLVELKTKK